MLGKMRAGGLESRREGRTKRMGGRQEGRRQARIEDALPGTHLCGSVGVSRLLLLVLCLQQLARNDRSCWRGGGGELGQLLQLLLAEVRCRPLRPGLRLTQGCQQSRSPLPPPARRPAQASGSGPDRR